MTLKVYLDTNIFIAAYERQDAISSCARAVLDMVDNGEIIGVISELVIAELLVKPLRENDQELGDIYAELFEPPKGYQACRVDRNVLIEAARQRAIHNKTKLPDAIHVATARLNKCRAFVTRDGKLEFPCDLIVIGLDASAPDNIRALA